MPQFVLYETTRERCGIDGRGYLLEQVGQRSDMILVAVGQYDAAYVVAVFHEVRPVRDDEIDAEHIILGEHQSRVDDQKVVTIFQYSAVFPNLPQPT